jgi:hypothetical protein
MIGSAIVLLAGAVLMLNREELVCLTGLLIAVFGLVSFGWEWLATFRDRLR